MWGNKGRLVWLLLGVLGSFIFIVGIVKLWGSCYITTDTVVDTSITSIHNMVEDELECNKDIYSNLTDKVGDNGYKESKD